MTIKLAFEGNPSLPSILNPTHPARNQEHNISGATNDVASDVVGGIVACERVTFLQMFLTDNTTVGIALEISMLDKRIIVISKWGNLCTDLCRPRWKARELHVVSDLKGEGSGD